MSNWNEQDHPRVGSGNINGGQFTSKQVGTATKAAKEAAGVEVKQEFDYDDPDMLDTIDGWFESNDGEDKGRYYDLLVGKNRLKEVLKFLKERGVRHDKPMIIDEDTFDGPIGDGKSVYYFQVMSKNQDDAESDDISLDEMYKKFGKK